MDRPLDTHGILDAIAAITSRRESGRLQITVSGSRGAFFFKDGKLLDARMGPFSGLPAVNHAISMGKANLKFDSRIQPPASTFIAIEERVLLRERFGIETEGPTETEDAALSVPTTPPVVLPEKENARVPIPTTPQVALPKETLPPEARAAHKSVQKPAEDNIINSGLRESRIRAARNRIAHRKESQRRLTPNRFLNLAAEDTRRKAEKEKGGIGNIQQEELGRTISPAITPQATTSKQAGNASFKSIYEEEKPEESPERALTSELSIIEKPAVIETPPATGTKRCPKCNRVYEEFRNYCRHDSTQLVSESNNSFNAAVKPEAVSLHVLFWILLAISLAVGGILGYLLNNYISRKPAEPTSIQAESEQNSNEDEHQPVVEGTLRGKEITLIKPEYPAKAKSEGLSGKVTVAIRVNKQGRVVSARALTGHPPLKVAAEAAARQSKFSPENLERQPFKNAGTITYTFK